jgi:hypothetical protein
MYCDETAKVCKDYGNATLGDKCTTNGKRWMIKSYLLSCGIPPLIRALLDLSVEF